MLKGYNMFIEKLTQRDIVELVKQVTGFNGKIAKVGKTEREMRISYLNDWYENILSVSDFDIKYVVNCFEETTAQHKNLFKTFMLKKFGNKYKDAFNNNLKQKYESELIK